MTTAADDLYGRMADAYNAGNRHRAHELADAYLARFHDETDGRRATARDIVAEMTPHAPYRIDDPCEWLWIDGGKSKWVWVGYDGNGYDQFPDDTKAENVAAVGRHRLRRIG